MFKFSKIAAVILLGATISAAQTAGAGENGATKSHKKTADNEVKLDMVSVTANKSETDIAKYAGQVSVINEDQLNKTQGISRCDKQGSGRADGR